MQYGPLIIRTLVDSTDAHTTDDNEYVTSTMLKVAKWLLSLFRQMVKFYITSNLTIWI